MKIEAIVKIKIILILLMPFVWIIVAWEEITFSSSKELIIFFPLTALYFLSSSMLKKLAVDGNYSYYTCEFLSLLLMFCLNIMLIIKGFF